MGLIARLCHGGSERSEAGDDSAAEAAGLFAVISLCWPRAQLSADAQDKAVSDAAEKARELQAEASRNTTW
jgi:hypothetical protein